MAIAPPVRRAAAAVLRAASQHPRVAAVRRPVKAPEKEVAAAVLRAVRTLLAVADSRRTAGGSA